MLLCVCMVLFIQSLECPGEHLGTHSTWLGFLNLPKLNKIQLKSTAEELRSDLATAPGPDPDLGLQLCILAMGKSGLIAAPGSAPLLELLLLTCLKSGDRSALHFWCLVVQTEGIRQLERSLRCSGSVSVSCCLLLHSSATALYSKSSALQHCNSTIIINTKEINTGALKVLADIFSKELETIFRENRCGSCISYFRGAFFKNNIQMQENLNYLFAFENLWNL